MPVTPNAQRETWADVVGDFDAQELVTADELLDILERVLEPGAAPNIDKLRYWQRAGVLPHPVRRWHDGATRALYPKQAATLAITELLTYQLNGFTLQQIGPMLRTVFKTWDLHRDDPFGWKDKAMELADQYQQKTGDRPTLVFLTFVGEHGGEDIYYFDVKNDSTVDLTSAMFDSMEGNDNKSHGSH